MPNTEQNQDLTNVEIFEAGTHRGFTYTHKHLDEMVSNFTTLADRVKPPLVCGHEEADGQVFLKHSGMPSFGWMSGVKREGDKLVASFAGVPAVMKGLIKKGAFKRISSEIYHNFKDGAKAYGMCLRRAAVLGSEIPELKSLEDIQALGYDETPEPEQQDETQWVTFTRQSEDDMGSEDKVTENEKEEKGTENEKEVEVVADTFSEDDVAKAVKTATDKLKATHSTELKGFGDRLLSVEAKSKRTAIDAFVEKYKAEGRYLPKFDELGVVTFMESLDNEAVVKFGEGDDVTQLGCFQELIRALPQAVDFNETAGNEDRPVEGGRMSDQLDTETKKYAEKHDVSYLEAMDKVRAADPRYDRDYS